MSIKLVNSTFINIDINNNHVNDNNTNNDDNNNDANNIIIHSFKGDLAGAAVPRLLGEVRSRPARPDPTAYVCMYVYDIYL